MRAVPRGESAGYTIGEIRHLGRAVVAFFGPRRTVHVVAAASPQGLWTQHAYIVLEHAVASGAFHEVLLLLAPLET